MRLADLVAQAGCQLATPDDNERLLAFFDRSAMQTSSFALTYRRAPDFFRLLRYQGHRSHVVLSLDDAGAVRAMGTISLRHGWIDGAPTTVGYLGDLRIGFQRKAIHTWRRLHNDVLARAHEIDELADCTHWLTVVMDDNELARRVLTTPRVGGATYAPIAPFRMVNVVARMGYGRNSTRRAWTVRRASQADMPQVTEFLDRQQRRTPFGFRDELTRRLACWDGLRPESFLLALRTGEIAACAAPWSASAAKQMLVSRLPLAMRLMERASRILPNGLVRLPVAGEALRVKYLTHLTFASALTADERRSAFRALLDTVFDERGAEDWHCIAFADFAAWNLATALRGYVHQSVPITVYSVLPSGGDFSHIQQMCASTPPGFEMATV